MSRCPVHDLVHIAREVGAEEGGQLVGAVERIAAAEPWLLGQLRERQEPLRPSGVTQAAACRTDREAFHGGSHHGAGSGWQPPVLAGHDAGEVLAVAAEQFVGAHPREDHLDAALARRLAHEQRVDRGRIADRLVEHVDDAGQQANDVGRDLDLVQFYAVPGRDLPRVDGVVRHGLQPLVLGAERDRVRVDAGIGPVRQDGDDAGVEAAGQEARHRHVGYQVRGDRLLDHRPQVRGRPGRGLGRHVRDTPVTPERGASVRAEARPRAGRQASAHRRRHTTARAPSSRASTPPGRRVRSATPDLPPPPAP